MGPVWRQDWLQALRRWCGGPCGGLADAAAPCGARIDQPVLGLHLPVLRGRTSGGPWPRAVVVRHVPVCADIRCGR